jgi:hypothetical protein
VKQTEALFLATLPLVALFLAPVLPVHSSGIIFIQGDGSIEGTNKIYRTGNVYTFAGDIEDSYGIIVNASNIIIDGNGHTLRSIPRILPVGAWDFGIELANFTSGNVTIKNLNILGFNIGVCLYTTHNTVEGTKILDSDMGILLADSPNTIVGNHIENNIEGIFMGPLPDTHETVYNVLYHNSFVNNTRQVYDCECTDPHTIQHLNIWDNGSEGNYWSNYNGTDADEDGIGDTSYPVSSDDVDMHPLMHPLTVNKNNGFLGTTISTELGLAFIAGAVIVIAAIGYVVFKRKKSKK